MFGFGGFFPLDLKMVFHLFFKSKGFIEKEFFQFPQKFGPALKREIERGIKMKVFYVLRGETGSYPSTHLLQGTPIDRGPITG